MLYQRSPERRHRGGRLSDHPLVLPAPPGLPSPHAPLPKSSHKKEEYFGTQHRFEHWYRDNTVYFITSRCRDQYPAFASENAKSIFWDRFTHYTTRYSFVPFVTSLLDNHYHTMGYLKRGENLGPLMQKLHGSVAKLVNDLLPQRREDFWTDSGHQTYFDGCLRDEAQFRRTYRYILHQSTRHRLADSWETYPHTRIHLDHDLALKRALELGAFLPDVPYKRYQRPAR